MAWNRKLLGIFVVAAAAAATQTAVAETADFNNPTIRDVRLDYCRHFGSQCGKPAADLFCREKGFVEAQRFVIDQNIGARGINTLVFGDGRFCQGPNCSGFRVITCSRPDQRQAAPDDKPPTFSLSPIQPVRPPSQAMVPVQPKKPAPPAAMVPAQPHQPAPPAISTVPVQPAPPPPVASTVPAAPLPPPRPEPSPPVTVAPIQPDKSAPPPLVSTTPILPLPSAEPKPSGSTTATLTPGRPSVSAHIDPRLAFPAGASLVRCLRSDCEFAVTYDYDIDPQAEYQSAYFIGNVEKINAAGGFRWQVVAEPFPEFGSGNDLAPPGLLASGDEPGPSRGFSLNFKEIAASAAQTPEKLHVRILPIAKPGENTVVGQPSNTIGIFYGSVPPPQPPITFYDFSPPNLFDVKIVSFTPPVFQNPNRWGCVVVQGYKTAIGGMTEQLFPIGREICPKSYKGEGDGRITSFRGFVDWAFGSIADAIDWVSERYDDLKQLAVDIAMKYTFFGAQCELIAGAIDNDTTGYCRVIAETAVSSGMVALGLPPTIPNYNELIDKGVDHAVELAVAEIEAQTGVPCIGPCKDALRAGFTEAARELKRSSYEPGCVGEEEAHKYGREPLCLPDFVIAKPAPGAVYTPPTAVIEVTRLFNEKKPDNLFDGKCWLGVGFRVENHFPGGTVWGPGTSPETREVPAQQVDGTLFGGDGVELSPDMPKGTTLTRNIIFQPPQKFIFPWTKQLWSWSQIPPRDEQGPMGPDWFSLYSGGTARIGASVNCAREGDTLTYRLPTL